MNKEQIEDIIEEIGLEMPIPYSWLVTSIQYIKNRKIKVGTGDRRSFYDMIRSMYFIAYSDLPVEVGVITLLKEFENYLEGTFKEIVKKHNYRKYNLKNVPYVLDPEVFDTAMEMVQSTLNTFKLKEITVPAIVEDLTPLQLMDPLFDIKFIKGEFTVKSTVKYPSESTIVIIEDNSLSMNNANSLEKTLAILKSIEQQITTVFKYHCSEDNMKLTDLFNINRSQTPAVFKLNSYIKRMDTDIPIIVITDCHEGEITPINYDGKLTIFDIRGNKILQQNSDKYTYKWI